jgi:hypothetical protein
MINFFSTKSKGGEAYVCRLNCYRCPRITQKALNSNFIINTTQKECNIIVCWENDWKNCPIEVIEFKKKLSKKSKEKN